MVVLPGMLIRGSGGKVGAEEFRQGWMSMEEPGFKNTGKKSCFLGKSWFSVRMGRLSPSRYKSLLVFVSLFLGLGHIPRIPSAPEGSGTWKDLETPPV